MSENRVKETRTGGAYRLDRDDLQDYEGGRG